MKTVGIIAEFNPFHNGHEYIINKAKEVTAADAAVIVMSGNYVQRGEPAIINKHARAAMALSCGADLVIELPAPYSTSSAKHFALGAVSILNSLGIIDCLAFGAENAEISLLSDIADVISEEPEEYKEYLKAGLKSGLSFPAARQQAVSKILGSNAEAVISMPNNILSLEYLIALKCLHSSIKPYAIARTGRGYNDTLMASNDGLKAYSSASAIRSQIAKFPMADNLIMNMPECAYEIYAKSLSFCTPILPDDFSLVLGNKLLEVTSPSELTKYQDINEDLANRIFNNIIHFKSFSQFAELLKTKNQTLLGINRALMHILLDIKEIISYEPEYYRILGFKKNSSYLLTEIKKSSEIPIISKLADAELSVSLNNELFRDSLYRLITMNKFGFALPTEHETPIAII